MKGMGTLGAPDAYKDFSNVPEFHSDEVTHSVADITKRMNKITEMEKADIARNRDFYDQMRDAEEMAMIADSLYHVAEAMSFAVTPHQNTNRLLGKLNQLRDEVQGELKELLDSFKGDVDGLIPDTSHIDHRRRGYAEHRRRGGDQEGGGVRDDSEEDEGSDSQRSGESTLPASDGQGGTFAAREGVKADDRAARREAAGLRHVEVLNRFREVMDHSARNGRSQVWTQESGDGRSPRKYRGRAAPQDS